MLDKQQFDSRAVSESEVSLLGVRVGLCRRYTVSVPGRGAFPEPPWVVPLSCFPNTFLFLTIPIRLHLVERINNLVYSSVVWLCVVVSTSLHSVVVLEIFQQASASPVHATPLLCWLSLACCTMHYDRVILYFDGASRNNPRGPAGCGWILKEMDEDGADSHVISKAAKSLGKFVSNNQAEYQGLIEGLTYVDERISCNSLYVRGDSEVVINQMNGDYQVRSPNIRPYYEEADEIRNRIQDNYYYNCKVYFRHVGREKNSEADRLANGAC
jgi:ribonuclease HI